MTFRIFNNLLGHPRVGASWEGFALSQFTQILRPAQLFFWSTYSGAEIDFFFLHRGRRYGAEFKFSEAPKITKSMRTAISDLDLEHLWVVYPGQHNYMVDKKVSVWPLQQIPDLATQLKESYKPES